jgi:hypothetical protein
MLSPRGLLSFAPWFAFAPLGLLAARDRVLRAEVIVCAVICGAFLAYNSGAINPFGGWTPGPRYLLPALPFAAVLVALVPGRIRPVVALLIAISILILLPATVTMPNAPELYRDPLVELWLPRLRDGHLADTIAWLRWGLHGLEPLGVLLFGLALAAAGLVASFRPRPMAAWVPIGTGALLLVLIVAFSLPYPPPTSVALGSSAESTTPSISVADLGAGQIATSSGGVLSMWAQLENAGPAIDDTRVEFSVLAPDGGRAWSAWYSGVDWAAGERRTASMDWDLRSATPGDYRVAIRVMSDATQATYASAVDPDVVHVDR